ncbi:MAG TPA: hypothetical protein VFT37_11845 [Telluria sp.]|nr:hypothetical protein [Telluria sp.]
MNKAIGIAVLAFAPLIAMAQTATLQRPPATQHPATAQTPTMAPQTGARIVVTPGSKELYAQAKAEALAGYKAARAQCDLLASVRKDICVAEAKAARVRYEEDATAQYKNTLAAHTRARMRIATANYNVDRARCGLVAGNDRDVCLGQAKATRIAAEADARADSKSTEAQTDALDEKRTAQYKVALEKCDAFAGVAKDSCVKAAKSTYGH